MSASRYLKMAVEFAKESLHTPINFCEMAQTLSFLLNSPEYPNHFTNIFSNNFDNTYSMIGSYGSDLKLLKSRQSIPLSMNLPAAQTIRENSVILIDGDSEMSSAFTNIPGMPDRTYYSSLISLPIPKRNFTLGAIVIQSEKLNFEQEALEFYELISSILAIVMVREIETAPINVVEVAAGVLGQSLTSRQAIMQKMMSQGFTNADISDQLGYSESTIRQESVQLFAKLRVHNREDAGNLINPAYGTQAPVPLT